MSGLNGVSGGPSPMAVAAAYAQNPKSQTNAKPEARVDGVETERMSPPPPSPTKDAGNSVNVRV